MRSDEVEPLACRPRRENSPSALRMAGVPLNSMCSSRWAMPVWP
ncbi:Uncharacterised protein [Bordetella pertussis]|nr:Uncharacterised protein [Bordetella pertussis]